MPFSELERKRIEQTVGAFCGKHSPVQLKDKLCLAYTVKGHEVVIIERRPRWDNESEWTESPVAKLKFIRTAARWRLSLRPSGEQDTAGIDNLIARLRQVASTMKVLEVTGGWERPLFAVISVRLITARLQIAEPIESDLTHLMNLFRYTRL
jgi:hypothetical protein